MIYQSTENRTDYAPPMLANGCISAALDYRGTQMYDKRALYPDMKLTVESRHIWWEGRRYGYPFIRPLIPFGRITAETLFNGVSAGEPREWEQELDVKKAVMHACCRYADGSEATTAFICAGENILAIEKSFDRDADYTLCYTVGERSDHAPNSEELLLRPARIAGGFRIGYSINAQRLYRGDILFFTDAECALSRTGKDHQITVHAPAGQKIHFYLIFGDTDEDETDVFALKRRLRSGFDKLRSAHEDAWNEYGSESFVRLPDPKLQSVYDTAQYDLRMNTTQWSIPTCINDACWEGKYFAFDEYFNMAGLLYTGHASGASHPVSFRAEGLAKAVKRASSKGIGEARYPWETVETHEEAATPGFWYEHIFHMSNIAIGQAQYAQVTGDTDYLREKGFPVIRACNEFFTKHMLYETDGKLILGRCTDLERIGSSVINAFMTTCSVIASLRYGAWAADTLGAEKELAAQWRATADRLQAALPQQDGRYIPTPDSPQRSIAVFSGLFPYPVFSQADEPLEKAMADYHEHESQYGNMYAMGGGVSTWYAAWKACAYARLGDGDRTLAALKQAAKPTGCFDEICEISEKDILYRPWFTTSAGVYVTAVAHMLLRAEGDTWYAAPAVPDSWTDFAFCLPGTGGRFLRFEVKGGKVERCEIIGKGRGKIRLVIPERFEK